MPVYEYECRKCSTAFEVRKSISDSTAAFCPRCQVEAHRLFSPVAVLFKGPGFYVTDNANRGKHDCCGSRREETAGKCKGGSDHADRKGDEAPQ